MKKNVTLKKLKEIRQNLNITESAMAEKLNLTFGTYHNYENGYRMPKADVMIDICQKLQISLDYLLNIEYSMPKMPQSVSTKMEALQILTTFNMLRYLGQRNDQQLIDMANQILKLLDKKKNCTV